MTLEAFQSWVLQTGLVVSLLIVIILMIRRPFSRLFGANAAYALWCLPFIRLVMPGLAVPQNWLPDQLLGFDRHLYLASCGCALVGLSTSPTISVSNDGKIRKRGTVGCLKT